MLAAFFTACFGIGLEAGELAAAAVSNSYSFVSAESEDGAGSVTVRVFEMKDGEVLGEMSKTLHVDGDDISVRVTDSKIEVNGEEIADLPNGTVSTVETSVISNVSAQGADGQDGLPGVDGRPGKDGASRSNVSVTVHATATAADIIAKNPPAVDAEAYSTVPFARDNALYRSPVVSETEEVLSNELPRGGAIDAQNIAAETKVTFYSRLVNLFKRYVASLFQS
jgi:hypothetical protein